MKPWSVLLALFLLGACQPSGEENAKSKLYTFYVGTYTNGESKGIYRYQLEPEGIMHSYGLAAPADNPSFLAMSGNRDFLLAVNEIDSNGTGMVTSFRIQADTLRQLSQSPSGGAHPCFVSINAKGYVLAANYSGGNTGLLRLKENGRLSDLLDVEQHSGSGTTSRQKHPHAHCAWFEAEGNGVVSADLGTNELWFSMLDTAKQILKPADPQKLAMSPGAGPRHLAFHPQKPLIYVMNELNSTVTMVRKTSGGNYQKKGSISTLPEDYDGKNTGADIHISNDGRLVYASNRGHNSLAIFRADPKTGRLQSVGHQSTHGKWPRNFSLSPDGKYLLVANQHSNNLVAFKRNASTGLLKYLNQIQAPSPVCILFRKSAPKRN